MCRRRAPRGPATLRPPALDALLRETGSDLIWEAEAESYVAPPLSRPTGATSYASSVERLATAAVPRLAPRTDPR